MHTVRALLWFCILQGCFIVIMTIIQRPWLMCVYVSYWSTWIDDISSTKPTNMYIASTRAQFKINTHRWWNWHPCIPDGLSVVQCSLGHVIGIVLFFLHNFSGMKRTCWTTGSWRSCLVSSIPAGSTIIHRFLCGFICVSLCQSIKIKTNKYVMVYVHLENGKGAKSQSATFFYLTTLMGGLRNEVMLTLWMPTDIVVSCGPFWVMLSGPHWPDSLMINMVIYACWWPGIISYYSICRHW